MIVFLKGATMIEGQIGKVWFTFLRPRFWCRRNLTRLIRMGVDRSDVE